jgi:hypothetical protein
MVAVLYASEPLLAELPVSHLSTRYRRTLEEEPSSNGEMLESFTMIALPDNTKNYIARIISYLEIPLDEARSFSWYDDLFLSGPVQTAAVRVRSRTDEPSSPRLRSLVVSARSVPFTGELDGTFQRAQPHGFVYLERPAFSRRSGVLD